VCPSRAARGWALGALAVGALACGDPITLIFDAGSDASVGGSGGSLGLGGAGGLFNVGGSAGASGAAGTGGAGGSAGLAGGGTGGLDAGALLDAGPDATDASQ